MGKPNISSLNIEWLDWNRTLNTGRRLDWSSTPTKIMPQLCLNSPAVEAQVMKRAALIGDEVRRGMAALKTAGKVELFLGVIAGWETQIGRDFDTGGYLGYCALANKGYNVNNPPQDIDEARAVIVKDFVDLWAESLAEGGVPGGKIFSHTAFLSKALFDKKRSGSYLELTNFAPPCVSFGPHHYPGFSTYPQPGALEDRQFHGNVSGQPVQSWRNIREHFRMGSRPKGQSISKVCREREGH
ncbi:MAG: hypothetical protein ABSG85_08800 [Spirochaetia bacterium]